MKYLSLILISIIGFLFSISFASASESETSKSESTASSHHATHPPHDHPDHDHLKILKDMDKRRKRKSHQD